MRSDGVVVVQRMDSGDIVAIFQDEVPDTTDDWVTTAFIIGAMV